MDASRFGHAIILSQFFPTTTTRARGLLLIGLLLGILPLRAGAQGSPGVETVTSPNVQENGRFGTALAGGKDVNGDGTPDLMVGALNRGDRKSASKVYLFSGADKTVLRSFTAPNANSAGFFGRAISGVGDSSGDDTPDLLVGAEGESIDDKRFAGQVYLFSGADGEVLRTFSSPNPKERGTFGSAVAGVGDFNGDGTSDLLIGAFGEKRVYLLDGTDGTTLRTLTSPNEKEDGSFGAALAGGMDVNGDGVSDLLVGALWESPESTKRAGRAYLFSGADGTVLQTLTSPNLEKLGGFGSAAALVEDANGDGVPDLLIGARGENAGGTKKSGRAYLFSGADGTVLRTLTSPNPEKDGDFGVAVTGGDLDGDGTPDLVIGARGESPAGTKQAGRVYLFDLEGSP